ncbi:L-idonate 5-dehydrogenase [Kribbella sp. NPDC050820]|uniref:L-idonate 5-dehydrogenase n=1 Tax=Kribbella sp. NPDC050820 TaxID=3155408 RepID=UPI0034000F69
MLALVVHGPGDLKFDDFPQPSPDLGQVLVRNTHGGICGSDLHYYRHGAVGAFALRQPLVLGHEVVGRVESDPSGTLPRGTPVAVHPASPCGDCPECAAGIRNVCRNARYLGSAASFPHTQGGFSEYMIVRQDQLRVLPPTLPLSRAVLAEPLAVGLHALNRAGGVAGAKVLVSGSGPIGILAAGAAKAAGADEVWTTDLLDLPLKIALDAGVDRTVRIGTDELPDQYFDVALEASGATVAVGPALAAVRRRGVLVQLGMFPPGPRPAELSGLVAKEIDVRGAFRFDTELDESIGLLAGTGVLDPVITHTFDLSDAVAAMDVAADPASSGKVVLRLSDS